MIDPPDTMKALTSIIVEKTLLDIGKPVYDIVVKNLYEKHQCYIPDCYEKPECLKQVLEEIYGESHKVIVKAIESELSEFAYKKKTETFLTVLIN